MAQFPSENIVGVTHDDSANTATINTAISPWAEFFSTLSALTADNTESYDVALLLGLEAACDGRDQILTSPVGRGALPFDGILAQNVQRSDGGDPATVEAQYRRQLYMAVYTAPPQVNPANAVGN